MTTSLDVTQERCPNAYANSEGPDQTAHLLFVDRFYSIQWLCKRAAKTLMRRIWDFTEENMPIQMYWKFDHQKIFRKKQSDIFLISAQNIDCGYSLEPPRQGGSNEYPQSMFLSRSKKNNVSRRF